MITRYELRGDANPDIVKTTQKNHKIEYFPKEERLPPLFTDDAVFSRDYFFFNHLVSSEVEQINSG